MNPMNNDLIELAGKTARSTISVLDAMFQRGAIRGEEAATVGELRNQCAQLIAVVEEAEADAAAASE